MEMQKNAQGWIPIRFIIEDEENRPIALTQVLIKKLFSINLIVRINRGPLLTFETCDENYILEVVKTILKEGKKEIGFLSF